MKIKIVLLVSGLMIALCLTLSSCKPCEEKEWDTLPPETQKGANTFGCYVNGELFVPRKGIPFTPTPLFVWWYKENRYIHIKSVGNKNRIDLYINNPKENEYNTIFIGFLTSGCSDCDVFGCSDCSHVFITKFDTINRIVSGTFEFSGKCASLIRENEDDEPKDLKVRITGDSVVQITKGRFDIRYYSWD